MVNRRPVRVAMHFKGVGAADSVEDSGTSRERGASRRPRPGLPS